MKTGNRTHGVYLYIRTLPNGNKEVVYVGREKNCFTHARAKDFKNHNEDIQILADKEGLEIAYGPQFISKSDAVGIEASLIRVFGIQAEGGTLFNRRQEIASDRALDDILGVQKLNGHTYDYEAELEALINSKANKSIEDYDIARNMVIGAIKEYKGVNPPKILIVGNEGAGGLEIAKAVLALWPEVDDITIAIQDFKMALKFKRELNLEKDMRLSFTGQDFLSHNFKNEKFDVVLMNPPFNNQKEFFNKAKELSDTIAFIFQLNEKIVKAGNKGFISETCEAHNPNVFNIAVWTFSGVWSRYHNEDFNPNWLIFRDQFSQFQGREAYSFKTRNGLPKKYENIDLRGFYLSFSFVGNPQEIYIDPNEHKEPYTFNDLVEDYDAKGEKHGFDKKKKDVYINLIEAVKLESEKEFAVVSKAKDLHKGYHTGYAGLAKSLTATKGSNNEN